MMINNKGCRCYDNTQLNISQNLENNFFFFKRVPASQIKYV